MLCCGKFRFQLDRPLIMGVVNVTPDSFSDGGEFDTVDKAIDHARRLIDEGADILDIGGESSRPGAQPVSTDEEMRRVLPVVEGLSSCGVPVSVDTRTAEVMRAAIAAGAAIINDIQALRGEGALEAVAGADVAVVLMHKQGDPQTMQAAPYYNDVVGEVATFLESRIAAAQAAGIARERIVIDPGFGFGKTLEHNLTLLQRLDELCRMGVPVLAGMSRKSMLGAITGRPASERLAAGLAAHLIAVLKGALLVRVHDVAATRDALRVVQTLNKL